MTLYAPLHAQNLTYSATLDRQLIDSLYSQGGIVLHTDLAVTQRGAGANMSVDVSSGHVVVTGTDAAGQGKYLCWSDATTNVVIATAPTAGNSRIDLIVAQVRDADQNGGANNDWVIAAVTGTPATTGTQAAPAAPASSFVLAQIAVGPSVTSIVNANIADLRTPTILGKANNPSGRIYAVTGTMSTTNAPLFLTTTSSHLKGGMTKSTHGLIVPVAGVYAVKASMWATMGGANSQAQVYISKNGSVVSAGNLDQVLSSTAFGLTADDDIVCAAGDDLTMWGVSSASNATMVNLNTSVYNYLAAHLVAQT